MGFKNYDYDDEDAPHLGNILSELVVSARQGSPEEVDGVLTNIEVDFEEAQGRLWDKFRQAVMDNAGTGLSMGDAMVALNAFSRSLKSIRAKGIMDATDKQHTVRQAIDAAREAGAVYKRLSVNSPALWRNTHDELMSVVAYEVRIVNSTEMQRIMEEFPDSGREIYELYNGRNSKYADAIRELGNVGRYGFTPGSEAAELDAASRSAALASRINNSDLVPALTRLQRDIYSPVSFDSTRSVKSGSLNAMQKLNDLFRMLNQRQPIQKVERYVNELVGWFALSGLKDSSLAQETIGALGGDWKKGNAVLDYLKESEYDSEAYDKAAIIVSDLVHKWERGGRKSVDETETTKSSSDFDATQKVYWLLQQIAHDIRSVMPPGERPIKNDIKRLLAKIDRHGDKISTIIGRSLPNLDIEKHDETLETLDKVRLAVERGAAQTSRDYINEIQNKWSFESDWWKKSKKKSISSVKMDYEWMAGTLDSIRRNIERLSSKLKKNRYDFDFTAADRITGAYESLVRVNTDTGSPNDSIMRDLISGMSLLSHYCIEKTNPRHAQREFVPEIIAKSDKLIALIDKLDLAKFVPDITKTYILKDKLRVEYAEAGVWGIYSIKGDKISVVRGVVTPFTVEYAIVEDNEGWRGGDRLDSGFFNVVVGSDHFDKEEYMQLDIAEKFEEAAIGELKRIASAINFRQFNMLQNYASEVMLVTLENASSI